MKNLTRGIVGMLALLSPCTGLYAATISETITGTILTGIDNAGVFGPLGANLAGKAATITYMLNAPLFALDGQYTFLTDITEQLFNGTVADGAITDTITVNGTSYALTQDSGGQETFLIQKNGGGSTVESLLFNPITGSGASITVQSNIPYQFPALLGNPGPFLDLVTANATAVSIEIDLLGGNFETDITVAAATPEPPTTILLMLVGLPVLYMMRKRRPGMAIDRQL